MFRDGSRVTAQREGQGAWGWEKFRLTSWKCLKKRTPTSVGTRALSVSHSKFSFPTSVSTVPLLYSPVPPYIPSFLAPFSRPPLSYVSWTSIGSRARIELWCRCSQDGVPCSKPFLGRESGMFARARMSWQPTWRGIVQTLDPFERIWPIKRGLRATLSSGLTQSTSFLSSRSPPLSPSLPFRRYVISGCIPPSDSTSCQGASPAPCTTVPIDELATTGLQILLEVCAGFYSPRRLSLDGFLIGTSREVARFTRDKTRPPLRDNSRRVE